MSFGTVNEGSDVTFTFSASPANPLQPTTVHFTTSGKARLQTDFTLSATEAVIPAGASSTTVTLHAVTDAVKEKNEKVTMKLVSGTGYKLSRQKKATVIIINAP